MITRRQLLSFWPDLLGLAALVLPFAFNVSPLKALSGGGLSITLLGVAFGLAIPIAVWQGLRVWRGTATKTERVVAYVLSVAAMLWPVVWPTLMLAEWFWRGQSLIGDQALTVILTISSWALVSANVLLLRSNLKAAAPAEVTAGVFLTGGYLPNAIFCIIGFSDNWGWNIGAYVVMGACIGYVLRMVLLVRGRRRIDSVSLEGESS